MSALLLLTSTTQPSADVLPALALLSHQVRILPAEGSALLEAPEVDLVLVDGRTELARARDLCRLIRTTADKGVVAILDPRLVTARYGRFLADSLPPMWRTTDRATVLTALQRLAAS